MNVEIIRNYGNATVEEFLTLTPHVFVVNQTIMAYFLSLLFI